MHPYFESSLQSQEKCLSFLLTIPPVRSHFLLSSQGSYSVNPLPPSSFPCLQHFTYTLCSFKWTLSCEIRNNCSSTRLSSLVALFSLVSSIATLLERSTSPCMFWKQFFNGSHGPLFLKGILEETDLWDEPQFLSLASEMLWAPISAFFILHSRFHSSSAVTSESVEANLVN